MFGSLMAVLLVTIFGMRLGLEKPHLVPLVFLGMPRFVWQSQFGQIDMLLCALVFAQLLFGFLIVKEERISYFKISILGLFSFLAIFSKGPAGVAPTLLALTLYAIFTKRKKSIFSLLAALLFALFLASFWLFLSGLAAGFDYPRALLFKQTVTRFLEPWHHYAPWYYYLGVMWAEGFPFILLLIPISVEILRKKEIPAEKWLLPFFFIFSYLLFFSLSSGKRSVYILPIYPMTALVVSFAMEEWGKKTFLPQNFEPVFGSNCLPFSYSNPRCF